MDNTMKKKEMNAILTDDELKVVTGGGDPFEDDPDVKENNYNEDIKERI